jgi:hypothetical protein
MTMTSSNGRQWKVLRGLALVVVSAGTLLACDSENSKEREGIPVSSGAQELREQAGLHPVDKRPAVIAVGDGGLRGANDPGLRQKAGLRPTSEKDYAKTPDQLREDVDLHPDRKPPPANEAEMRERMDLHPERVEETP